MVEQNLETPKTETPKTDTSQETKQTPSPTKETSEKLYAGKYKAPEELEKGYKELESMHGKAVSEKDQQIKEANERYEQLVSQLTSRQQTQQEETYETPEEKLQKEVDTLKIKDRQRDLESLTNKFLEANPDLKGKAEQKISWQIFQELNATKGQYWSIDRMMEETAKQARQELAEIKERAIKEVTEVRNQVKNDEIPKGTPPAESVDTEENETAQDVVRWRREAHARTRSLV